MKNQIDPELNAPRSAQWQVTRSGHAEQMRLASILILAGMAVICAVAQETNPSGQDSEAATAFRRFLSDPPWIKKIVYGRSGDQFMIVTDGEKSRPHAGFAWYEAALQPSASYLKQLSNSVAGQDNLAGDGSVVGNAGNMFWSLGADAKELCFEQVEDPTSTSPITVLSLKGGVERSRDEVRTVMKLGITHLAPGTLRWLSDDAFEAESTGEFGRIHGRITRWENGAPARLEYDVQKIPGHKCVVRYGYSPNRGFPPAEIALSHVTSGKETAWSSDQIRELDIGEFGGSFPGFRPSDFAPGLDRSLHELRYISNGVLYLMKPDGRAASLGAGTVPDFDALSPERGGAGVAIYLTLTAIFASAAAWAGWRRRNAHIRFTENAQSR